ncbi:MAG: beta-1,6-N-acetylglucosaminyltransferase [Cetobacterium sp.]
MKIAYIIQAHKNLIQIENLIEKLQGDFKDKIHIYVHIDSKNKVLKENLKEKYNGDNTVIVLNKTIKVNWSGLSQVKATLISFKVLLESGYKYKYISLISGECYPLKSPKEILEFFKKTNFEYIEYEKCEKYSWRLNHYNFFTENPRNRGLIIRILNKVLRKVQEFFKVQRNYFYGKKIYKGSSWFSLTSDAVKYIINEVENNQILDKYKLTSCPDEHFFQNILLNSPYKNKIINDNLRYIDWSEQKSSPKIFLLEEIDCLVTDKLFIRKIKIGEK